jgi:hypothetical protein
VKILCPFKKIITSTSSAGFMEVKLEGKLFQEFAEKVFLFFSCLILILDEWIENGGREKNLMMILVKLNLYS